MSQQPRNLLHALTLARGWPYAVVAIEYRRVGMQIGDEYDDDLFRNAEISEPTWRRWTSGHPLIPNKPAPHILERLFGYTVRELMGPAPTSGAASLESVLTESDITMTAREAAAHAGDAASAHLPDMTLDQLDDDVQALAVDYETTDPVTAFRKAEALLLDAQDKLTRTRRPSQHSRLYLAAGQAGALLSVASFDLGMLGPATQFARTAAMYGQVIEHGPLQAYAHGVLAYLAYWDGRPTAALRDVQVAKSFAGVGDTGRIRLSAIEARAYAHLGRVREAERALRTALEPGSGARDELHDDVGGEFAFAPERAAMSHTTTYLVLGDHQRAEASALHALHLLENVPHADRPVLMQVTVDLARARLQRDELDGADEALAPVFATSVEWRTIGLVDRVSHLRTSLTRHDMGRAPLGRELAERIEDFIAVTAARPLPGSRIALES
ncbi:hypothetical protein [Streptomyces sp. CBMA152]|uniref:hypothetical protein n=1 Tax=Streptomyces sp. CBMA152 TaxID=1896312 RepID=UPI001660699A|nr:hypothetical protein [Streptomyces sp. CBMA152]MBD0744980.1 hypothetical protein [Streptomyces sp. CBMA152]